MPLQPQLTSDALGGVDDSVRVLLDGQELLLAESWQITESILSQPAQFDITVGTGDTVLDLMHRYPPRTRFELRIGDVTQMRGRTDGWRARNGGGATELLLRGRDGLAPLYDSYIDHDENFAEETYSGLVRRMMKESGLDPSLLIGSNAANRSIKAGVNVLELASPRLIDEILQTPTAPGGAIGGVIAPVAQQLQSKLGERKLEFIRRHIDRAGLMLWATADGKFVLSRPNAEQQPTYHLVRRRGQTRDEVNVLDAELVNETTYRHSHAVIYGRGGGRKYARHKAKGSFTDAEMVDFGFVDADGNPSQGIVFRDVNVQDERQAAFFAQRKLAEERRNGWQLNYEVAGHRLPAMGGGWAVVVPDTIARVDDDELGLHDVFYLETVVKRRSPHTTTSIRMMRVGDLVFGGNDS